MRIECERVRAELEHHVVPGGSFQCHIQRRQFGKRRTVGNPVPDGTDNAFGHGNDLRSEAEPILIRRTVDVTDNRNAVLVQTYNVYGESFVR